MSPSCSNSQPIHEEKVPQAPLIPAGKHSGSDRSRVDGQRIGTGFGGKRKARRH